jgi:hypothetical protein
VLSSAAALLDGLFEQPAAIVQYRSGILVASCAEICRIDHQATLHHQPLRRRSQSLTIGKVKQDGIHAADLRAAEGI